MKKVRSVTQSILLLVLFTLCALHMVYAEKTGTLFFVDLQNIQYQGEGFAQSSVLTDALTGHQIIYASNKKVTVIVRPENNILPEIQREDSGKQASSDTVIIRRLQGNASIQLQNTSSAKAIGRCMKYNQQGQECEEWEITSIPFTEKETEVIFDVNTSGMYAAIPSNEGKTYKPPTFSGTTTHLEKGANKRIAGFTLDRPGKSRIEFLEEVDLDGVDTVEQLGTAVRMYKNYVEIDTKTEPALNKPAQITLYGTRYLFPPILWKNGKQCNECSLLAWGGTNTIFSVPHFTNYTSSANSQIQIYDTEDTLQEYQKVYHYEYVDFFANYSNVTSQQPINGTNRYCEFSDGTNTVNMTYNLTSKLYEYRKWYASIGTKTWNVSCDGSIAGYEPLNVSDSINIQNRSDKWSPVSVQSGTISGTGNVSKAITAVNTSKSFIVFTSRVNDQTPDDWQTTTRFVSNTSISFDRYNPTAASATIGYFVVTSDSIKSQQGQQEFSSGITGTNITITPVNPATSFAIVYGRCNSNTNSNAQSGFFLANITNATNLEVYRGNAGSCAATASWQVIDWAATSVQAGSIIIPDLSDSASTTINSVNLSRAFVVFGAASIGTDQGMDSNLIQASIPGTTQLTFSKLPGTSYASSQSNIAYYVVELPQGEVQAGTTALSGDTGQTITLINLSETFFVGSGYNTGGGQTYSNSLYHANFTNATRLNLDKETGSQTQTIAWFIVDAPIGDAVPSFSGIMENPINNSVYSPPTTSYTFNVTITGTNGSAGIMFDGISYPATNTSSTYTVTLNNLDAGAHTYYWWAYGTGIYSPYNRTNTRTYTVQQATGGVQTYVNNSQQNITIERLSTIYLNGTRTNGEGAIELYNNGTLINTGTTSIWNVTQFTENGMYNISTILAATQNYTSATQTWWITVVDTTSPVLTNIKNESITDVTAIILWDTDENANSTVDWGNTTARDNQSSDALAVTSHSILLSDLAPSTTYYYNVTSCDPSGNCNTSGGYNFTTLSEPDITSPSIENVTAISITETTANITWDMSENANGTVLWGTTTALGNIITDAAFFSSMNIELTGLSARTLYYYNVTSCDPSGNCNTSGGYNFTTVDTTPPMWENISVYPPNNTQYQMGTAYTFNTTWTDNIAVDTVLIEHNFTGTLVNSSTTPYGNSSSFNISNLSAGTYTWRMWANDTSNNSAYSDSSKYVVTKIPAQVNITLNGTYQNMTIQKQENVTINASIIIPTNGTIEILRDGVQIASGINTTGVVETFNLIGTYNITVQYTGSQNYSSATNTLFVTVTNAPPSHPTNVQAENNIAYIAPGVTTSTIALSNTYNLSKTFMKIHHMADTGGNADADQTTVSAHFVNNTHIQLNRYAGAGYGAYLSYSILQADNINVVNFTKSWATNELSALVTLDNELVDEYATKCFVETHRNIQVNAADSTSFAEQEVQAFIEDTTHVNLSRGVESGTAEQSIEYGYVICFLDETSVQTGTFSIAGDVGTTVPVGISPITTNESFATINYFQNDDGVGQNSLLANFSSSTQLDIYRDEIGGGQTAYGNWWIVDFEDEANAYVQHIPYLAAGTGGVLVYETQSFSSVDQNKTYLQCENTMANGGGTAHSRGQFVFRINDSNDSVYVQEGRDRSNTQDAYTQCQIILWPNLTTYLPPADLIVTNITLPQGMYQDVETTINVTINNTGQAAGENITLQLNVSHWNGTSWEYNVTSLGYVEILYGGTGTVVQIPWNASRGERNFTLFVDSNYQTDEANETNNIYSANFTVVAPTITEVGAYINNTRGNTSIGVFDIVLLNASLITGEGNISLYLNGTKINTGASPLWNSTSFDELIEVNVTAEYIGNENYTNASETWTLTIIPGQPPILSTIAVTPMINAATVAWNTNYVANSTVGYGTTTALGQQVINSSASTTHSIILSSLNPSTTYYYQINSCNINGCTNSSITSFVTRPPSYACAALYVEKGPNWVDGLIQKGDVVEYVCQIPGGVGENEEVHIRANWDTAEDTKILTTPRLLYKENEVLYP